VEEQQPSSETTQAAVEKIRRKSYRELKLSLDFFVLLDQAKRTKQEYFKIFCFKIKA
jgi:hypothetical protein